MQANTTRATVLDMGHYTREGAETAIKTGIVTGRVRQVNESVMAENGRLKKQIEAQRRALAYYRNRPRRRPSIRTVDAMLAGVIVGAALIAVLWWVVETALLHDSTGAATLMDAVVARRWMIGLSTVYAVLGFFGGRASMRKTCEANRKENAQ